MNAALPNKFAVLIGGSRALSNAVKHGFARALYCAFVAACVLSTAPAQAAVRPDVERAAKALLDAKLPAVMAATDGLLAAPGLSRDDRIVLHAMRARAQYRAGGDGGGELALATHAVPGIGENAVVKTSLANVWMSIGNQSDARGDWAASVHNYSQVIEYYCGCAAAYIARGNAYLADNDIDAAIADFKTAIAHDSTSAHDRLVLGGAYEMKLDYAAAIGQYGAAIALDPGDNNAYGARGRDLAALGRYAEARRDLERAIAIDPRCVSNLVWLHIVHLRTGEDDRAWIVKISQGMAYPDWPGTAWDYFRGRIGAAQMLHIALTGAYTAKMHQRCDGWFYLGEEAVARHDVAVARALFRKTAERCNAVDFEWSTAKMELRRLGGA